MAALRFFAFGLIAVLLLGPAEAKDSAPCAVLHDACASAGFTQPDGDYAATEIVRDCMSPLLNGVPAPGNGKLALPMVERKVIAACKDVRAKTGRQSTNAVLANGTEVGNPPEPVLARPETLGKTPNIVLILVDDFSMNLMTQENGVLQDSMPNLSQLQRDGASFAKYFVTDSLCCPSRTSIFTGLLPHNSGVYGNSGTDGGYEAFMSNRDDRKSIAVALHDAFYATAMMGKYLNGYEPDSHGVPRGWTTWAVSGNGYANFNYTVNKNGKLIAPKPHLTDEISELGQAFIRNAEGPFFLELAPFSPHSPYVPPIRYANAFPDLTYPLTPAYGARPDAAAPTWLQKIPPLERGFKTKIDQDYRRRVQSDKGVDDMIGVVRQTLADLGLSQTTYVVFTSDNGYHMGEYSLRVGKLTPFDTDIHVPLVIVGPGIAAGQVVEDIAMNIDLYPTFLDWAGLPPSPSVDGRSLATALKGNTGPRRALAVVEHRQAGQSPDDPDAASAKAGDPPTYVALRMADAMYVEYLDGSGEVGYYDLTVDPFELHNIADGLSVQKRRALHEAVLANQACAGAVECAAAQALAP